MMDLDELAPGVMGCTVEHDGALYIPLIISLEPGKGNVARYLDSLPQNRDVRVPCVTSGRLRGMLTRRGFKPASEWAEELLEHIEVFQRRATERKESGQ